MRYGAMLETSGFVRPSRIHPTAFANTQDQVWLIFIPAFYSFFYGGTMGTYLSLHFSVRARALSSLIVRECTD